MSYSKLSVIASNDKDDKGNANDSIKKLIQENRKFRQNLATNPLFREFRQNRGNKSYGKVLDIAPPNFTDSEAEAQGRMIDLIKNTAINQEKPMRGVWAAFGSPYVCNGDPMELKNVLPKLYRDELLAAEQETSKPVTQRKPIRTSQRHSGMGKTPLESGEEMKRRIEAKFKAEHQHEDSAREASPLVFEQKSTVQQDPQPSGRGLYSREKFSRSLHPKSGPQQHNVPLQSEQVQLLHFFYEQLCTLVEQQRMGDPLSLSITHKVKSLLESGIFLHRSLLLHTIRHVAEFCTSCGLLQKHNKFILPILTFIAKCVEVDPHNELIDMVLSANLQGVVYGGDAPPKALPTLSESEGGSSVMGLVRGGPRMKAKGSVGVRYAPVGGVSRRNSSGTGVVLAGVGASSMRSQMSVE